MKFFLLFILATTAIYSQEPEFPINTKIDIPEPYTIREIDTTIASNKKKLHKVYSAENYKPVFAKVIEDYTSYGESVGCSAGYDFTFNKGEYAIVSNIIKCSDYREYPDGYLFKVCVNGRAYYADAKNFVILPENIAMINEMSYEENESYEQQALKMSETFFKSNKDAGIAIIKSHVPKGLSITEFSIGDTSEYTSGTNVYFECYNPTGKIIKYVTLYVKALNPVKDVVKDPKTGKTIIDLKCVGPIKPYQKGRYVFKYVWFSDLPETASITKILVQYMDGTIKTINNYKDIIIPTQYLFVTE